MVSATSSLESYFHHFTILVLLYVFFPFLPTQGQDREKSKRGEREKLSLYIWKTKSIYRLSFLRKRGRIYLYIASNYSLASDIILIDSLFSCYWWRCWGVRDEKALFWNCSVDEEEEEVGRLCRIAAAAPVGCDVISTWLDGGGGGTSLARCSTKWCCCLLLLPFSRCCTALLSAAETRRCFFKRSIRFRMSLSSGPWNDANSRRSSPS